MQRRVTQDKALLYFHLTEEPEFSQIQLFHFLLFLPAPSSSSCPLSSVHSPKPLNSEHSGSDGEEKQHNLMESKYNVLDREVTEVGWIGITERNS